MQQFARVLALKFIQLPRAHRLLLLMLSSITLSVLLLRLPSTHFYDGQDKVQAESTEDIAPDASEPLDQDTLDPDTANDDINDDADDNGQHSYTVSAGDTLSTILTQYGIDMSDIQTMIRAEKDLANLHIGQSLTWTLDQSGAIQTLSLQKSRTETLVLERNSADDFVVKKVMMQGQWHDSVINGSVTGNFADSAKKAGLNGAEVASLTRALQWQLDFRKLRTGDKFSILMSRETIDQNLGRSQLLGVRLNTAGKDYYAFLADDGKYYDAAANGLTQGFLRYPTARTYRVSSKFNPHRLNPVTYRIAPHRGVDFAMPIGTPVLSIGDGEVIKVNKLGGSGGNYVAIRHGRQYMTRYMHLSRVLVSAGQKVKKGDRIALSGNTGRSTGPHLHFEIWINNQAVNPLTASLPRSEGLSGKDKQQYLSKVRDWKTRLNFAE